MSPSNRLSWGWKAQPEPTAPVAAVAWGAVARDLHARLASMGAERLRGLQATANRDVLIVSGESSRLPWVAGVEYACACEQAPQLWLPSLWQPDVAMDLLAQALQAKFVASADYLRAARSLAAGHGRTAGTHRGVLALIPVLFSARRNRMRPPV